jgi:hypothetical protein
MNTEMQHMEPGKMPGTYTRRWLLKSSATMTAAAAAVASLSPGVASAATVANTPSRKIPAAHALHDDFEVGGI